MLALFNRVALRSELFNRTLCLCSNNWLLKGGIITGLLWATLFRKRESETRDREFIVCGIVLSIASLVVARTLALLLPFRERPRFNPLLHFVSPCGTTDVTLIHWSSFPSDNATLFFALATCLYFVSRRLGIFAYLHALFVVTLPRIYFGWHYPTDILCGALLGIGMVSLCRFNRVRAAIVRLPLGWAEHSPAAFYFCFYLFTFLVAAEFGPVREAAKEVWRMTHNARPLP